MDEEKDNNFSLNDAINSLYTQTLNENAKWKKMLIIRSLVSLINYNISCNFTCYKI